MKRTLCALLALIWIACTAWAEPAIQPVSPTPSATPSAPPAGVPFTGDGLSATLPAGFEILEGDALSGYAAAVESDYPGAAQIALAAADAARDAYICFLLTETDMAAADAAREAAERILGGSEGVTDLEYGENPWSAFACAIGERTYSLYFLSDGARLLAVAVSGLEEGEIADMLTGLTF